MRIVRWTTAAAAGLALLAGSPYEGAAQVRIRVDASVEWRSGPDGGYYEVWHEPARYDPRYDGRYEPRYDDPRYDPRYDPGYAPRYEPRYPRADRRYRPRRDRGAMLRIPPGHYPPRGMCRAWLPGRPPGHQPAPRPCGVLLRHGVPYDAVILGLAPRPRVAPPALGPRRGPPGKPGRGKGKGWKKGKRGWGGG